MRSRERSRASPRQSPSFAARAHSRRATDSQSRALRNHGRRRARGNARDALNALGIGIRGDDALLIDVAPGYLLQAGLPYAHSDIAIILDATSHRRARALRGRERAARLVGILADAVPRGGTSCVRPTRGSCTTCSRRGRVVRKFTPSDDAAESARRAQRVAGEALYRSRASALKSFRRARRSHRGRDVAAWSRARRVHLARERHGGRTDSRADVRLRQSRALRQAMEARLQRRRLPQRRDTRNRST